MFKEFTSADLDKIKSLSTVRNFKKGELIFSEGDDADFDYFIEAGSVSILIWKFTSQEEIATLGPGEYFGEMALFSNDKRTASVVAKTDIRLLRVDKNEFLQLVRTDGVIARKGGDTIAKRNEELALREKLVDITGIRRRDLHISIKGDQSLRETALSRERYESVVDKILPMLQPSLEDLLLNRCIYQVVIGFDNDEVITSSVFDPFGEEIHQAAKRSTRPMSTGNFRWSTTRKRH